MILESEMFDNEESVVHEIVDEFVADHFEKPSEITQDMGSLIHDAIAYGIYHALSRLKHGRVVLDDSGEAVDRKLYALEELLFDATVCLGLDDDEEEDIEDTDDEFEDTKEEGDVKLLH